MPHAANLWQGGWVHDPEATEEFVASLPQPRFAGVASELAQDDASDIFFWETEQQVLGKLLPSHSQGTRDCVAHAYAVGAQDLLLDNIASGKDEMWIGELSTEIIYGGGRVDIGQKKLNNLPGLVGAWAAQFLLRYGMLTRGKYGDLDLSSYSSINAAKLGDEGVPESLKPLARQHPIKTVSLVSTANELWAAMGNYSPVPISSRQGFTTVRGKNGICDPQGRWDHCLLARGRCTVKGGKRCIALKNWIGDYLFTNPQVELESGDTIALPADTFLAELGVCDGMVSLRDSFALSSAVGFKKV